MEKKMLIITISPTKNKIFFNYRITHVFTRNFCKFSITDFFRQYAYFVFNGKNKIFIIIKFHIFKE